MAQLCENAGAPAPAPAIAIIVPAHDERAGIAATLAALGAALGGTGEGIIVSCNGCTDDTAAVARAAAPQARVVECAQRGKAGAINRALAQAADGPVIVLDADIHIDRPVLMALVAALETPGVLAVSPAVRFDATGSAALVRAFARIISRHPYLTSGVGGAGVYGLSREGRAMLGALPAVVADDHYVREFLPAAGQMRVAQAADGTPVAVTVRMPRGVRALLAGEIRARRGDRQLRGVVGQGAAAPEHGWMGAAFAKHPIDFMIFIAIKLIARAALLFPRGTHSTGWSPHRH